MYIKLAQCYVLLCIAFLLFASPEFVCEIAMEAYYLFAQVASPEVAWWVSSLFLLVFNEIFY